MLFNLVKTESRVDAEMRTQVHNWMIKSSLETMKPTTTGAFWQIKGKKREFRMLRMQFLAAARIAKNECLDIKIS